VFTDKPAEFEVVVGIVKDNMGVGSSIPERIDRCSTKAISRPGSRLGWELVNDVSEH